MKKTILLFTAILCFFLVMPAQARTRETIGVAAGMTGTADAISADSPLPTGTIIVLSIIGVLLVIGIFILVRILRGNDDR
ncbi:MAG: hypothetical protein HND47_19850 [Chloroflexi bacterium]|nr:hypothetical protein [Chloroflexota bacterium]